MVDSRPGAVRLYLSAALLLTATHGAFTQQQYSPGAGNQQVLYQEGFSGPEARGWELQPGWEIREHAPRQWALHGVGHHWAHLAGRTWGDCTLKLRLNLLRGHLHVNYRVNGPVRYFVGFGHEGLYLSKQTGPHEFSQAVARADVAFEPGQWHDVEITGRGGRLEVRVDGRVALDYADTDPLGSGEIAFEALEESEAYIDDVMVLAAGGAAQPRLDRQERPRVVAVAPIVTPLPAGAALETAKPLVAMPVPLGDPQYTWVHTGGPIGGLGYDIRMRQDDPDIMFVTDAWGGIFRSNNRGQSWFASNGDGSPQRSITARAGRSGDAVPAFSLTIDPHNADVMWVGTQQRRGIFRSTDGGRTWARLEAGVEEDIGLSFRGFTVDPRSSQIVYAAGELSSQAWAGEPRGGRSLDLVKGVVYRTANGGESWVRIWRGDNLARYVVIDPRNPDVIYVSTGIFDREAANSDAAGDFGGGVGILKSTDGGRNWQTVNNGLTNLYVGSLFMHPQNPDVLLAGAGCNPYPEGAGVFITDDGGRTWHRTLPDDVITSVEFSSANPSIAYAGSAEAIYRSEDGGYTWRRTSRRQHMWGPPGIRAGWPIDFQVDPRDANRIFANNYGGGSFLSTDGGRSWRNASKGYTGAQIRRLVVDSAKPHRVFAAGRSGLFVTADRGAHWQGLLSPPAIQLDWNGLAVDPGDPQHVLAANNWGAANLCESHDGGGTWRVAHALNTARRGWRTIVFAPSRPSRAYAGTGSFPSASTFEDTWPAMGIYASDDGGKSWFPAGGAYQNAHVAALAVDPKYPMLVYAATTTHGMLKTTDGGNTWTPANTGLPATPRVLSVAVNPTNRGHIYCGVRRGGLYRSTDAGATWKLMAAGMEPNASISSIVFDPANPDIMYVADLWSGVYRSGNRGTSWQRINHGLKERAVNALAFVPDGSVLYAGTEGNGVYRLKLKGP